MSDEVIDLLRELINAADTMADRFDALSLQYNSDPPSRDAALALEAYQVVRAKRIAAAERYAAMLLTFTGK